MRGGKWIEALPVIEKAYAILAASLGAKHSRTRGAASMAARICKHLRRPKIGAEWHARSKK
jgi:hypothetical protein